jgi:hypothetical protein
MTITVWAGVGIAVQSALATAITIGSGGITKADPGVMTYTGTDPSNGDYLIVNAQGMYQVDEKIVRVANVNAGANTLELEGVDTTGYDTLTSGTAQVITFGTTLSIVAGVTVSGGDFNFIDTTTIHDLVNKQQPGNANAMQINFDCLWDPSDVGLIALKEASDIKAERAMRITFANGYKVLISGYVGATGFPTGAAQQRTSTPVSFSVFGKPTFYTT